VTQRKNPALSFWHQECYTKQAEQGTQSMSYVLFLNRHLFRYMPVRLVANWQEKLARRPTIGVDA
jgi:hypothetical protein